ncbi:hypothetical protein GCM10008955_34540 [Deinococcus malanensis]|uniref:DinB-like domain-containing protein n=1 Tax=Deinococcus malanensis TaxID=1706855 RepID=A0ABQ2F416_9DEIO|nr:DinB family protein [Deinococcus malanensis]GGK37732.1 hypothetical protein GCM10008955_34540 [Deinococcus malanensis]
MTPLQSFLSTALDAEFRAFGNALHAVPATVFGRAAAYGHSAAWYALHIMDWTRCVIQPGLGGVNPALTYGYLGFEEADWVRRVTGPTLAAEDDTKDQILTALDQVFTQALKAVCTASAERFTSEALWATLKRPRPVLEGLTSHLRHTAYHRGQIAPLLKEFQ